MYCIKISEYHADSDAKVYTEAAVILSSGNLKENSDVLPDSVQSHLSENPGGDCLGEELCRGREVAGCL